MIIKTINTDYNDHEKTRKNDVPKHTSFKKDNSFSLQRQYMRALNFTKVERLLAKPFIKAWSDAKEGILNISKSENRDLFAVNSFDGLIMVYDIEKKDVVVMKNISELMSSTENIFSKSDYCKSVSFLEDDILVSYKNDILLYDNMLKNEKMAYKTSGHVNHLSGKKTFLVSSNYGVEVFDPERITPKFSYEEFGPTIFSDFNADSTIIGSCTENGKIFLVDNRIEKEFASISCGIKTNSLCFSPDLKYFVSANEDSNVYLHDLRYTNNTSGVFRHHVNSVTDVKYRPNGNEIVTASYDKTIRIFRVNERKSRDVYYNKRMGQVYSICYDTTGNKILSGSDDGSLRLWRSDASIKENIDFRELKALKEGKNLKNKFKDINEIKRIDRHRFLPKKLRADMKNRNEHYKAVIRKKEKYNKLEEENKKNEEENE